MSTNIEVILKQDVEHVGAVGEIVRVRRGFARNYLIPRGYAVAATRANRKFAAHEQRIAEQKAAKVRAEQEGIAAQLASTAVMIAKEANEEGKLFGSVTNQDVAEALEAKGMIVDRRKLVMPEKAIKEVGSYPVKVKLAQGVVAEFNVEVKTKA